MSQMNSPVMSGQKPHRGTMVLVLGILSIVIGGCGIGLILGIIAIVMGNADLKEMASGTMDKSGEGLTKAGKICGIVGCVIGVLGLLYLIFIVVLGVGMAAAGAGAAAGGAGNPPFLLP